MMRKSILLALTMGFLICVVWCSSWVLIGVVTSHEKMMAGDATVDGLAPQTILLLEVADSELDIDVGAVQNSVEVIDVAKLTVDSPGSESPMAKIIAWQNVEKVATAIRGTCMTETALAKNVKKKAVEVAKKVIRDEVEAGTVHWMIVANEQRAPSTSNGTCTCDKMVLLLCT